MAHTVFVGLSGGVDSAVSAALLKEQGHEVVGVFIKIWQPEFTECTWQSDRLDAMRVSAALGIPFREVDFSEQYKKDVVERMVATYAKGETPNPDVLCNKSIKFGAFAEWARAEGAHAIATGHYARVEKEFDNAVLLRGADTTKDQSYFLHRLTKHDLARAVFPIGELTKAQVRARARSYGLPVADKPDSQGLCFVGNVAMSDFLKRFIPVSPGRLVDKKGRTIGEHEGAPLYTIGERHGFSVTKPNLAKIPHYVIAIDTARNTVTVSPERMDAARTRVTVDDAHWIGPLPALPAEFLAQTRYRENPVRVALSREGETLTAIFYEPHVVSPGQAIVFYDGECCLGGGVIGKK